MHWKEEHQYSVEDIGGYGGALAFHLLEHNQNVKAVNPALAADKRKSNSNPKKNDAWDALCVAKVLIDEFANLPTAYLQDEHLLVKHCVNRRDSLTFELTKTKKQLHNELSYHYPSYKKFFTDIIGKAALAFWTKYPSPSCLEGAAVEGIAEFLRKYSNNGLSTRKAEEINKAGWSCSTFRTRDQRHLDTKLRKTSFILTTRNW